ncbi:MAG: hypothetical protein U1E61_02140 [Bradyrhizobium sp.]
MATSLDEKKKKPGRLPLIVLGVFAMACLVALVFLGDLARYQESSMVGESQAALRDVGNPEQLEQALKRFPSNRILKLVALAGEKSAEIDAGMRKMLGEAEPPALARPVDLATASRSDLEALHRDVKLAESNVALLAPRLAALVRAKRSELESSARSLGMESGTVARLMAAVDEEHGEISGFASRVLAANADYYGAYEKCTALLVREFGSYKSANGQFIFRLAPTADSYNACSAGMAAAAQRLAELEREKGALRQSQPGRWKQFVGG